MSGDGAGDGGDAGALADEYEGLVSAEERAADDDEYGFTSLTGGVLGTEGFHEEADRAERGAYWEEQKGELPWAFYKDPMNWRDLGRGLINLAMPMGAKVARALFTGEFSPDANQTPVGSDEFGAEGPGYAYSSPNPRMTRVAAKSAPVPAETAPTPAPTPSAAPLRTATGESRTGIMANVRTTPHGLLGEAPVTRKVLLGS